MSEEPMQKLVTLAAFFLVEKKGHQKREKNDPASGREMASYKANNLVIESPAFERCIFINLSVRNW